MSERILMVTPYPPIRDGIGTYAAQEVKNLLGDGHDVEVLSPQPSAAHHHLVLRGRRGPYALAKRVRDYDRVVVQFHPDLFYPHPVASADRAVITAGLLACCTRGGNVEFRIHEFKTEWGGRGPHAELLRQLWKAAHRVEVHTERERERFCAAYRLPSDALHVVDHGAHFERRAWSTDRAAVRAALGIGDGEFAFVSIGFLQPHKGFDRAVRALGRMARADVRLDVVGSLRLSEPEYLGYVEELRDLVADTPGAHLHDRFVSDERFDEWLLAADCLVLPYRTIWSSGVMERARLFGTRVIATRVGGLEAQAAAEGTNATFVDDDDELVVAMSLVVGGGDHVPEPGSWKPVVSPGVVPDRGAIQAALRSRAAVHRTATAAPTASARPARRGGVLRTMPGLALPQPDSGRPLGRFAKRLVHRLTYWQVAPIVHHVNQLQRAAARDDEAKEA